MVVTVLEAHVEPERWGDLERAYRDAVRELPVPLVKTFLTRGAEDRLLWRLVSVWRSREELESYRRSMETPRGVLIFRAAGAEPSLLLFDVVTSAGSWPAGT